MGEDASLDDFLDGPSKQSGATDTAEPTADPAAESTADGTDVEPAATTYAWDGDGTACESCGETVRRRWRQADALVCVDCKDWERA